MKLAIIVGLVFVLLLTACQPQQPLVSDEVVCNTPYIRHGTECCLDQNQNNICDNDEDLQEPNVEEVEVVAVQPTCSGDGKLSPFIDDEGNHLQSYDGVREYMLKHLDEEDAQRMMDTSDEQMKDLMEIFLLQDGVYHCQVSVMLTP